MPKTVDSRVALTFARRARFNTHWIEMEYPVGAEPTDLLADLAKVGWAPDGMKVPSMEKVTWDANHVMTRHGYHVEEIHIVGPHGTDLFGGWSDDEKRVNMAAARKVLRAYGFVKVPVWSKTLQDML